MKPALLLLAALLAVAACKGQPAKPVDQSKAQPLDPDREPPAGALPAGALYVWQGQKNPVTYSIEGATLTLSSTAAEGGTKTTVLLRFPGAPDKSFVLDGGMSSPHVRFGEARIDAERPDGQFLFTTYTGGAHCCDQVTALLRGPEGFEEVPLGEWDGGLAPLADLNGDKVVDLRFADNRFNYAFDCYACSYPPPVIVNLKDGKPVDVSKDPSFGQVFEMAMAEAKEKCAAEALGGCAGYAAAASRLGRKDEAMAEIRGRLGPQAAQTGFELQPCASALPTECEGKAPAKAFKTFLPALDWFLTRTGY